MMHSAQLPLPTATQPQCPNCSAATVNERRQMGRADDGAREGDHQRPSALTHHEGDHQRPSALTHHDSNVSGGSSGASEHTIVRPWRGATRAPHADRSVQDSERRLNEAMPNVAPITSASTMPSAPPNAAPHTSNSGAPTIAGCVPADSYVDIRFDGASVVRSNLGGKGGRCTDPSECDEVQSASTAREIYIRDVGVHELGAEYNGGQRANRAPIDLRITNLTEYHGWNTPLNGIKHKTGMRDGSFGVINLLGPRDPSQSGFIWNSDLTMVELRYEFVTRAAPYTAASTPTPLVVRRTYLSFYDFDTGVPRFDGSATQAEAMQLEGAAQTILPATTELHTFPSWAALVGDAKLRSFHPSSAARAHLDTWTSNVTAATTYGVGGDNPFSTYALTPLQANRSIMFMFESVSEFRVRYAIDACCTTGRNFLVGGFSPLITPLC